MEEQFSRTIGLIGEENIEKIFNSKVAIFGIGGVGGYCAEALARSGIGHIDIVDNDIIAESNLNRQIVALKSTIGKYKVDVMKARIHDINPKAVVNAYKIFYLPENADEFDLSSYDYVIDAIDTVSAKLELIERAKMAGSPVISSMGAGNKLNPAAFQVADIEATSVCPLAKVMRKELKKRGIAGVKVVYSKETAIKQNGEERAAPSSNAFVPAVCGLIIAGEVFNDIISQTSKGNKL